MSPNPQPVRHRCWWHSTTQRQAEREGGGRSKEEKERRGEGCHYRSKKGGAADTKDGEYLCPSLALLHRRHHTTTIAFELPVVSHLADTTSLAKWNVHHHDRNHVEALSSSLAQLVS